MDERATKRAALTVATLTSFLTPFMGSSVNIALPTIGREFAMDAVFLSWIATAFLLSAAMFLVPFGRIADIYGRKKIFLYGILIYALSSLLSAIAPSAGWLLGFRILQGIGSSMIFGTSIAILTSVYPAGERGKVLGISVAAVYLGLSLGPFLGGFLTQHLGWRSIFLLNVPLSLVIIAATLWKLKGEWAQAKGEKFDFYGSAIYAVTLPALMYGFSLLPSLNGVWLIAAGLLGFSAFVAFEAKTQSPVVDMNLFRKNRVFAFSSLAALINYGATFAVGFFMSLYLQYTKGLDPQHAGIVLVSQPAIQAVLSPLAGRLSDRIEPRVVASTGMAFTTVALILFTFLGQDTALAYIIFSLVIIGIGLALFSSPNTNAIMSSVEKRSYGVAAATVGTMRLTGQMLSMGITMLIFAVFIGRAEITPEKYPQFLQSARTAFMIFTVICFGGIFASLARGDVRSKQNNSADPNSGKIP
jgi:EmrB/QacA subfamily drug resistance transporter